jgi:hypothetical protein
MDQGIIQNVKCHYTDTDTDFMRKLINEVKFIKEFQSSFSIKDVFSQQHLLGMQ